VEEASLAGGGKAGAAANPLPSDVLSSFEGATVVEPRVDKLLEKIDSQYASVIVAAKRARQISSYYHGLGEGHFGEYVPPMVDTRSKNYLTIALEEIEADKLKYQYR
jgi:DNA-directed RNA polymerase subunit omega